MGWLDGALDRPGRGAARAMRGEKRSLNELISEIALNGINLPALAAGSSKERNKSIVFVGRIHPKKGLKELLKAWAMCDSARPTSCQTSSLLQQDSRPQSRL